MILTLGLGLGLGILMVVVYIMLKIYYYFYPNRTLEATINNTELAEQIAAAGNDGNDGTHGILHSIAIDAPNGPEGVFGGSGSAGQSFNDPGSKGHVGKDGTLGPEGIPGKHGGPGEPSNYIIPYVTQTINAHLETIPVQICHCFSYNGSIHKLTGSFLFDDVSYFSFENSDDHSKYKIFTGTNSGFTSLNLTSVPPPTPLTVWPTPPTGEGRKIYANIRIFLERKNSSSDGTIFYISPPINRNGYLLVSNINLNNIFSGSNKLTEITINEHKEFGLDFTLEKTSDNYYNFMIGGLLRYRAIFNIEPPIPDVIPRIEESLSNREITNFSIHSIKIPAKGNIIKTKEQIMNSNLDTQINLISPRLNQGFVIYKDSSNIKNPFEVQNYKTIEESINSEYPLITQALDILETDVIRFKDELEKVKLIKVFDKYDSPDIIPNLLISTKHKLGNPNNGEHMFEIFRDRYIDSIKQVELKYKDVYQATTPIDLAAAQASYHAAIDNKNTAYIEYKYSLDSLNININMYPPTKGEVFSTKMTVKNLFMGFSTESSPISYPSSLAGSKLYIKFYVRIKRSDFILQKYDVFVDPTYDSVVTVIDNDSLVIVTRNPWAGNYDAPDLYLPVNYREGYIYFPIEIKFNQNIPFEKVFGRRIVLKLSTTKLSFVSHFGPPENFYDPDGFVGGHVTRLDAQETDNAFEGANTPYDFESGVDDIFGFDYRFEASHFDVEGDAFKIGYITPFSNNPVFQKVSGYKATNGDYYILIPPNNYKN